MKIGIDAKWYFTGPVSTQTVLQNLLPRLVAHYPSYEWYVFLDENDREYNFPIHQQNITTRYVWANNNMLSNIFILPRIAQKEKLDVVVFQTYPGLMGKQKAIAFIHDVLFRDYPHFFTWKERLYFSLLPWFTRRAKRLIATTNYVANNLVQHQYTESKASIDIVPLATSPEFKPLENHDPVILQETREKFHLPEKYLLFVGRLNVRKNIENLLRALLLLKPIPLPLVIVGKEDWKTPNLNMLLSHPELNDNIFIHGSMSNQELAATYAMANIFCFPSFAEGFGLPPLEAMASGVPTIVAKSTGLVEVCGDAAVFIDPADPQSIADAINSLLSDKTLYLAKQKQSIAQAANYNWDNSAHEFMKSISNAINQFE